MSPPCTFPSPPTDNAGQSPATSRPLPSIEELRAAIPEECFEKSLLTSLLYLCLDLVVIGALYAVVPFVETVLGWPGLLAWYCVMGMFLFSLFCVGHDCGHGTFSEWEWINDIFGHLSHAPLMAPYWPWQKSHRQHHQYTSHLDKDKGHPWVTKENFDSESWLSKHFVKVPLYGLVGWNIVYTVLGIPDGSHFWPFSPMFTTNVDRLKCIVSAAMVLLCSWVAFSSFCAYSPWLFFKYYYVPLMFQGYWLVIITYLQHRDEQVEVYEEGSWQFVRGQLQTFDRVYGLGMDAAMHHITDGHVAHHLFFTKIPHYHLPAATKAIRQVLEKYPGTYKRCNNYDFFPHFLWLNVKLEFLVGKGTGMLKYRSAAEADGKAE